MALSEANKLNLATAKEDREAEREASAKELADKETVVTSLHETSNVDTAEDKATTSIILLYINFAITLHFVSPARK